MRSVVSIAPHRCGVVLVVVVVVVVVPMAGRWFATRRRVHTAPHGGVIVAHRKPVVAHDVDVVAVAAVAVLC